QVTPHGTYRLARDGEVFGLQLRLQDRRQTMVEFTPGAQAHVDCEVANWFTSTHPRSLFTQNLVVCRVVGETRVNLFNTNLSVRYPNGQVEQRAMADAAELGRLLEDVMGLELPVPAEVIWEKAAKRIGSLGP